jgi:hypothetical protein
MAPDMASYSNGKVLWARKHRKHRKHRKLESIFLNLLNQDRHIRLRNKL